MLVRSPVVGGRGQVVGRLAQRISETSFSVRGEKQVNSGMCVGGVWLWVSGVEIWLLMVANLSLK